LALLDDWYQQDWDHPFLAVIGLGGIGKSALTWDWLQRQLRQGQAPPLVVWWSFYETDGTMDRLMAQVLAHFGDDPRQFMTLRATVDRVIFRLQTNPALLILDGAERLLRAYGSLGAAYQADETEGGAAGAGMRQCIDPVTDTLLAWLAQPGLTQATTLMSSRMFPQELTGRSGGLLAGVRRHDLTGLFPDDAQELFRQAGIQATRAEVIAVAEPVGYHPLSLRLLAQTAANDPQRPGDLRAAANYDPQADLLGKRQHILSRAYDSLPETARQTLSRLAAFRSSVGWETVDAVLGDNPQTRQDLRRLEERGLLQCARTDDAAVHYDLHPIVRRYAYARLLNGREIHAQLVSYFKAVPRPEKVQTLADLTPLIEQYHHLTRSGRYDDARVFFRDRLHNPLYYQLGAYQVYAELLRALIPDGEARPPRLQDERAQAWTLNTLANSYSLVGRPAAARPLFEQQIAIREKQGDKKNTAIGLGNLAQQQIAIGSFTAAATNLRRSIVLCQEIEDRLQEAVAHQLYGRLLAFCGDAAGMVAELETALAPFVEERHAQGQGVCWLYHAQAALRQGDGRTAQTASQEAFRLVDEASRQSFPFERDYVEAHWLLGWAALAVGDYGEAQARLDEALRRCRAINMVKLEPAILLAQARLARTVGQNSISANSAEEARLAAERSGYRLHLADSHNLLAQLALDKSDPAAACAHAQQAYNYALCDGPPHAYQSALDEAQRLLAAANE